MIPITEEQLVPRVFIDAEISFSDISEKYYSVINQFQPFGPENMAPVFVSRNIFETGNGRMVGTSGEHLKLSLCQESTGNKAFPAIAFGQANHFEYIKSGKPFDICYTIDINEFRGTKTLQLNIRDIKPPSDQIENFN